MRPDTFEMTLPSGQKVLCWQKDREQIRAEVWAFGSVMLVNDDDPEVYRLVPYGSDEYRIRQASARPG